MLHVMAVADEGVGRGKFETQTSNKSYSSRQLTHGVQDVRQFSLFLFEKVDALYMFIKFTCAIIS